MEFCVVTHVEFHLETVRSLSIAYIHTGLNAHVLDGCIHKHMLHAARESTYTHVLNTHMHEVWTSLMLLNSLQTPQTVMLQCSEVRTDDTHVQTCDVGIPGTLFRHVGNLYVGNCKLEQ